LKACLEEDDEGDRVSLDEYLRDIINIMNKEKIKFRFKMR
jgi:hypothetical protein